MSEDELDEVEADTFWCVSKLLDGIQVWHRGVREGTAYKNLYVNAW